jgi:hypothetical protein
MFGSEEINRFCFLVQEINTLSQDLKDKHDKFYDGGTPFETCHSSDIKQLIEYQDELRTLIPYIA